MTNFGLFKALFITFLLTPKPAFQRFFLPRLFITQAKKIVPVLVVAQKKNGFLWLSLCWQYSFIAVQRCVFFLSSSAVPYTFIGVM